MRHEAIFSLYANVVTVDDNVGALDKDGNLIAINETAVEAKVVELKAKAKTDKQTQVANKQSALAKLMALGLTEEEALALGVK
jgi:hypothetical protein